MTETERVKRALAALAARPEFGDEEREVIDAAVAAIRDVEAAVAFSETVGVGRLEAAVTAADRHGEEDCARRGRRALTAFRWFRRVA